jgi:hypothetical protein
MQSPIILEKFMMLWQSWPTSMESISIYYFFYWFHAVIKIQRCPESQWAPHDGMGHGAWGMGHGAWATGDTHEDYQALPLRKDKFMLLSLG